MKTIYYSAYIFLLTLVFIAILLWLDLIVFHSKLWAIKGVIYITKEVQLHAVKVRGEDYKKFYIANKGDLLIMKENHNLNSLLPYKKENIEIDNISCTWWTCEFEWNDNYILVFNPDHSKTIWEVFKKNATFVNLIIDSDWYVLARCTRFTCNENQLQ